MKFNYSNLLGKIKAKGFSQEKFADAINIDKSTLSAKLNGHSTFTQVEIDKMCQILDISTREIGSYFFTK